MRHRYLVAYDISDDRRLRQIYKRMHGFGDPLQYSVFRCDLSDVEKLEMIRVIHELIHHEEDRVMIVDVGPAEGRAEVSFEYIGRPPATPERAGPVIV